LRFAELICGARTFVGHVGGIKENVSSGFKLKFLVVVVNQRLTFLIKSGEI
jgi:hypothetical protein